VDLALIEFAPDVLNKAFALDKTMFQAPLALAHYYLETGQGRLALPYFELALEAAPPKSKSGIRLERAMCFLSIGNREEAEADFERVMRDPKLRIPALARVVLLKKDDQDSDSAEEIRLELQRPDLSVKERIWLLLSLGCLHENGGDFDGAFVNFERSRRLLDSKFDAKRLLALVDDAETVMTHEIFDRASLVCHISEKPIFVVGLPRSGTTMTEKIIAAHSQTEGVGELRRMMDMA